MVRLKRIGSCCSPLKFTNATGLAARRKEVLDALRDAMLLRHGNNEEPPRLTDGDVSRALKRKHSVIHVPNILDPTRLPVQLLFVYISRTVMQ
jgi:hypothetical protein